MEAFTRHSVPHSNSHLWEVRGTADVRSFRTNAHGWWRRLIANYELWWFPWKDISSLHKTVDYYQAAFVSFRFFFLLFLAKPNENLRYGRYSNANEKLVQCQPNQNHYSRIEIIKWILLLVMLLVMWMPYGVNIRVMMLWGSRKMRKKAALVSVGACAHVNFMRN